MMPTVVCRQQHICEKAGQGLAALIKPVSKAEVLPDLQGCPGVKRHLAPDGESAAEGVARGIAAVDALNDACPIIDLDRGLVELSHGV